MIFEWDDNKERANIRNHGVSFADASLVFLDPFRIERYDSMHSKLGEDRYITIGYVNCLLSVVYTERDNDTIRLISARRANSEERREYDS